MADVTKGEVTSWVGWVYFAGLLLILSGAFQMIAGLTALLNDKFYAVTHQSLLVFDITTWGWVHMLLGLLVIVTGTAVMSGQTWSRVVAVVLASLVVIEQFAFITAYPIWSIVMIGVAVLTIYALAVHGGELKREAFYR